MRDTDSPLRPSLPAACLAPYDPRRPDTPVDLRLDANEGPLPDPDLLEEIARAGLEPLRRYPDARELTRLIAAHLRVEPERVLVTAGGDDALERALRVMLGPGREMILPSPTFEMLGRYAALAGGTVRRVPWLEGTFPIEAVLEAVNARTAVIAVVTPNSPTGLAAAASDLERLAAAAPHALLLVDLAYAEFADADLTGAALGLQNALVVRSLSKAWGLAGLRVGFAAGPAPVIGWLRAAGHPYAVSAPSLAAAVAALRRGDERVRAFAAKVREERAQLVARLLDRGVSALPSQGNFVLCRTARAAWVRDGLLGLGIAVRAFAGDPDLADALRITLPGDAAAFERLCAALDTALAPEAVLFDMDDTLADVTRSYRGATLATAESFGVAATLEDITAAKAAGNANDDWELTWRLIRNRGVEASLAEVTRRFEEIYQGTVDEPGLRATERLLVPRDALAALERRVKLGVVTGRPRRDAAAFLEASGTADLFAAVVTMEDAPLKPSSAPVRLALARLGVERAWMVGDTPDDVRAARGAGVIPIGIVAPADDPAVAVPALARAGAGRVISNLTELEELVP